jgi:hypothetical protein
MTLYLLDANVLIRAHEDYYPVDRIPQYWDWLIAMAALDIIQMPRVIFDEVKPPPGPFADWIGQRSVRESLVLRETIPVSRVRHVLENGYGADLTDIELEEIGKDPFLVAAAMAAPGRVVVTVEVSAPKRQRQNRKVPDVCKAFDVRSIHPFELYRTLKFSIS